MADENKDEGAGKSNAEAEMSDSPRTPPVKAGNGGAVVVTPALATAGGHGAAAHDAHGHGLAHTTPVWLLFGILGALMVLTVLTVSVTSFDLGSQGNLVVAMIIATIKAALVVSFFMHLVWDKKLHLILFLTSVLFLVLFLSLSVNDRGEYQPDIDTYINATQSGAR
jgi:cytochrome c oxidase subunit 4